MQLIDNLKEQNCIFDKLPTIDELLDSAEERDMEESSTFEGGDKEIADAVCHEVAISNDEVINVDSDDDNSDDNDDTHLSVTCMDLINLCQHLEASCMQYGDLQFSLNLSSQLHVFHAKLQQEQLMTTTQTSLDQFFIV